MKKMLNKDSIAGLLAILFVLVSIPVFGLLIPYLTKYAIPAMITYIKLCTTGALCTICVYSLKLAVWVSFGVWMILFVIMLIGVIGGILESIF